MFEETPQQIIAALKTMDLFKGLTDLQLEQIATVIQPIELAAGDVLKPVEGQDDPFSIIVAGHIRLGSNQGGKEPRYRILRPGGFLGAEGLLYGERRWVSATAIHKVRLYQISPKLLAPLVRDIPLFQANLKAIAHLYHTALSKTFRWLPEDEQLLFVSHKHPAYLIVSLALPFGLGMIALLPFLVASWVDLAAVRLAGIWTGLIILAAALLWGIWRWLDFGNDYYIVTNLRAVWLEQVFLLYDSRQEAPLGSVRSVDIATTFIGRQLGFGDLTIETYTSRVVFRQIGVPNKIKDLVDQSTKEARQRLQQEETKTMERFIRQKIGLPVEGGAAAQSSQASGAPASKGLSLSLANYFKTRVESGGVITYHKHLFVLSLKVLVPSVLILGLLILTVVVVWMRSTGRIGFPSVPAIFLLSGLLFVFPIAWWLYQFIDWRNDIYQLTADKLIDIERKPLGDEVSKSAALDSIQSIEHERLGIIGLLFNYGDVKINVGGNIFTFRGVQDPARVQQDIFDRLTAFRRKKEEAEANKQRGWVGDWLAAYHRQINFPQKPPQTGQK